MVMADAVVSVLRYARSSEDDFTFGPLDHDTLMRTGLELYGSTAGVLSELRHSVPRLEILGG